MWKYGASTQGYQDGNGNKIIAKEEKMENRYGQWLFCKWSVWANRQETFSVVMLKHVEKGLIEVSFSKIVVLLGLRREWRGEEREVSLVKYVELPALSDAM